MNYKIDIKRISDGNIHIQGWVLPNNPNLKVDFKVLLENKNEIDFKLTRMLRNDVAQIYLEGFTGDKSISAINL